MVKPADVSRVARWRPTVRPRHFKELDRMMVWLDKFDTTLSHSHDSYTKHKPELIILRKTINGEIPEYADGPNIDDIIADIVRFGRATPTAPLSAPVLQLFPGADLPETGVDGLIEIPGVWQPTAADDILGPCSMVI